MYLVVVCERTWACSHCTVCGAACLFNNIDTAETTHTSPCICPGRQTCHFSKDCFKKIFCENQKIPQHLSFFLGENWIERVWKLDTLVPHTQWPEFHSLPEAFIVKQAKPFPLQNMELNFAQLFQHFCLIGAADMANKFIQGNIWILDTHFGVNILAVKSSHFHIYKRAIITFSNTQMHYNY